MEEKQKKKVALYIRVSTEEQIDMFGVDLQREALLGLIKSKGGEYELAGEEYIYIDEGESGTKEPMERVAFRKLMEDITLSDTPPFDIVAVYKIDRFARRLKILLEIIDIFEKQEPKIEFLSSQESIDTSTPFGRAMLGIIGVIAELELETIKERTHAGRQQAAEKGAFMNTAPLGYVKDENKKLLIQKEETEVVRSIFNMFVHDRFSQGEIAEYLRDHKVPSPIEYRFIHHKEDPNKKRKGSRHGRYHWYPEVVGRILKDEVYIGNQYYNKSKDGNKLPQDKWDIYRHKQAIIDKELFQKAQEYRSRSNHLRRGNYSKQQRLYLLQGLLKCANCFDPTKHTEPYSWNGLPHKVRSTGEMAYYYECSCKNTSKSKTRDTVCHTISLPAIPLEQHVLQLVYDLIKDPTPVFHHQQKLESSKNDIKRKKGQLDNLLDLLNTHASARSRVIEMYQNGDIKKEEKIERIKDLDKKYKRYIKEKEDLESELSIFTNTHEYIKVFNIFKDKYGDALKMLEEKGSDQELYSLIHMIVDEIIIFSRPKRKTDSVSGPKKEGQMIPYKLKISLKIPSKMLGEMLFSLEPELKLQAEKHGWWTT
ncbi:MAG: recombinase family protein [Candidatus Dojkabacteria bacterium]|nr:recombinase family protein [Candidatus Dojkabacteria bacterium]